MRLLIFVNVLTAAVSLATAPAMAQSTGMKNGSEPAGMTAHCSPGDPNVMVNLKAKTYALDKAANKAAMHAKSGKAMKMSSAADSSATSGNSTMKSMCKSEADSMGAKMSSGVK